MPGILLLILLLAGGVIAVSAVVADQIIHPARQAIDRTPASMTPPLAYQDVTIRAADGILVRGWWIPASQPKATILLLHGVPHDRREVLPQARYLHDAGYDLLLFDWRALGASDGSFTSYGYYEKRDLKAALDYAAQHGNGKIGVVGYSTGAAVAILEGSQDPRIRAIVADSCYATLDDTVSTAFPILNPYHLPAFPFAPLAEKIAELETGLRTSDLRPIDRVAEFAPRPILFIYGSKDQYVPPADSVRLYGAAREPKQLLEIPNAGHPSSGHEAFQVAPDLYKARVLAFFAAALQP